VRLLGSADLKTIERPHQLQFVSGYESGWVDFLAPPAALFIVFLWAMIVHYYLLAWFIVIGYLLLALWWLHSPVTRLFVSDTELLARGNLGRSYSDTRRVKTDELKSMSHFHGAQNEPAGLYAYHAWTKTCLIPRLTQQEANSIIETIHRKFPYIEHGHEIAMTAIHAEANGEFHPHIAILEVDPLDDLRHWQAAKARELEMENLRQWAAPKSDDLESK
jgi:hypothetical protein